MKMIALGLMMFAAAVGAEDFRYTGIKEIKALMPAAKNAPPAVLTPRPVCSKSDARAAYSAAANSCVEGYYCRSSGYESDGGTPTCFEYYYYTVCGENCRVSAYCSTTYNGTCKIWRRDASCD